MKKLKKELSVLIDIAQTIGLNQYDTEQSLQYLEYQEYGLCLDHIVTQLYEYDVEITAPIYQLIEDIGIQLKLHPNDYSFMKEMIRGKNETPLQAARKVSTIIKSLADTNRNLPG